MTSIAMFPQTATGSRTGESLFRCYADAGGELARDRMLGTARADRDRPAERRRRGKLHLLAGNQAELVEVAQQRVVRVRHPLDRRGLAGLELVQAAQLALRELQLRARDRVAVRVVRREAERGVDQRLQLLRDGVLEPVGLGVDGVDRDAERL